MKKLFILFFAIACFTAQAQDVVGKKTHNKTATKKKPATQQNYESRNGSMKVHNIADHETLDSAKKIQESAPQVNHNYNENTPPLSPSNGSK